MKKVFEIRIRMDCEELRRTKDKALQVGMNVSDFIRFLCFNSQIQVSTNGDTSFKKKIN
jgi:predicted DNA binding CopG/RHH family protein